MEVANMPNYIEMLRLYEAGFSLRQIAKLVSSGRNTVTRTIKIAQEKELSYDEVAQWSRHELETMFQLDRNKKDQPVSYYTMPVCFAIEKYIVLQRKIHNVATQ